MILDFAVVTLKNITRLIRAGDLVTGSDPRLGDKREPIAHTHEIEDIVGVPFDRILTGPDGEVLSGADGEVLYQ